MILNNINFFQGPDNKKFSYNGENKLIIEASKYFNWKPPPEAQRMISLMEEIRDMTDYVEYWENVFREHNSVPEVAEYLKQHDVK